MKIISVILLAAGFAFGQTDPGYGSIQAPGDLAYEHGLVNRTQNDLRRAADFERHLSHGKEAMQYEGARRHLADFNQRLTDGQFDKGNLDSAIDDVKNAVDRNTLKTDARDAMRNDLMDLRQMRLLHSTQ